MEADADRERRFEAIVAQVYEPLQRYLGRRAPADDVSELLNDVLLVLWRRVDDLPIDDLHPWSYGIAKRCLANQRRGNDRRLRLVGRLAAERPVAPSESNDALMRALDELGESERELVRLWAWEQLEPREIAIVLDTTANAVSLRLARARRKLASAIERQNHISAGHEVDGHGKKTRS